MWQAVLTVYLLIGAVVACLCYAALGKMIDNYEELEEQHKRDLGELEDNVRSGIPVSVLLLVVVVAWLPLGVAMALNIRAPRS